jgi:hypothetical protein
MPPGPVRRGALTEAASGAYAVTPVLAAMAKAASVFALARTSRYGTSAEVSAETVALARMAGWPTVWSWSPRSSAGSWPVPTS